MEVKNFVLQNWVQLDLIRLLRITTHDNFSDVMTKATARTIFYRHNNYIMGKIVPTYVQCLSIQKDYVSSHFHKSLKCEKGIIHGRV